MRLGDGGGVDEEKADGVSNAVDRGLLGHQRKARAGSGYRRGIQELVCTLRQAELRQTAGQCAEHGSGSAVGNHGVAVREHQGLRHVSRDPNMLRRNPTTAGSV